VPRTSLKNFISNEIVFDIKKTRSESTWFPDYQEIIEVGLSGQRKYSPRYENIYDFSFLKDAVVVDFGASSGQAVLEAHFCGAYKCYAFDCQPSLVKTISKISKTLGTNITSALVDFNSDSFIDDVLTVVSEWDWAIFQAVYRTKEIKDIKSIFSFIVESSKKGVVFEGHADPKIDTDNFYQKVFREFNFSKIEYIGHSDNRPAYILTK
jgi:hypothetical protein